MTSIIRAISEGMAASVAGSLWGWGRERRWRSAVEAAMRAFEVSHPRWADSSFDRVLLQRPDADEALRAGDAPALARAWTQQFRYVDERRRERDVRALTAVAHEFLELLACYDTQQRPGRDGCRRGVPGRPTALRRRGPAPEPSGSPAC